MSKTFTMDDQEYAKLMFSGIYAGIAMHALMHTTADDDNVVKYSWEIADKMVTEFARRINEAEAKEESNKQQQKKDQDTPF